MKSNIILLVLYSAYAKINEEYFFPKGLLPWAELENGLLSIDDLGIASREYKFANSMKKITVDSLGKGIDLKSMEKIINDLPRKVAEKVLGESAQYQDYESFDDYDEMLTDVIVFQFPEINLANGTNFVMTITDLVPEYPQDEEFEIIDFESEVEAVPNFKQSDEAFSQKHIAFEIQESTGEMIQIVLVELETDTRHFELLDTWIDSVNSDTVKLKSSLKMSNFDANQTFGFFDFRGLLWNFEDIEFQKTHETCFEPISCFLISYGQIECSFNYYQKRENCSDIYETEFYLGNEWHFSTLPVNRYTPMVFDASHGKQNYVHLSPCAKQLSVVIEDLDGIGAAVKVPTVTLVGTSKSLELISLPEYQTAYQHGLILYIFNDTQSALTEDFRNNEVFIEIVDHPISDIDTKKSRTKVKWKSTQCDVKKNASAGKSVYHNVIPFCDAKLVTETIQASLRQLEHVINIDVLEIQLSKSKTVEKGLNVVVTSTDKRISMQQRKEIQEAVNIGRILATCLEKGEKIEDLIDSTSLAEKREVEERTSKRVKSTNTGKKFPALAPRSLAVDYQDVESEEIESFDNSKYFIFVSVGLAIIATCFRYFWLYKTNLKILVILDFTIVVQISTHLLMIIDIGLACGIWIAYGKDQEIVDENILVRNSMLGLTIISIFSDFLRLFSFHNSYENFKFKRMDTTFFVVDSIWRVLPYSVIISLWIIKYRPVSFAPSPYHILFFMIQLITIACFGALSLPSAIEKLKKIKCLKTHDIIETSAFIVFFTSILVAQLILVISTAFPALDLQTQNRCINIQQLTDGNLLSSGAPWKCLNAYDILLVTAAISGVIAGLFLLFWQCYMIKKMPCTGRLRNYSSGSLKTQESIKTKNEMFGPNIASSSRAENIIKPL